jgi:hypothetical protein
MERNTRSAHCTPMNASSQKFVSASEAYQVSPEGVSFVMTDGVRDVRCRVGRAALESRTAGAKGGIAAVFDANREMIFLLAAQKLSLHGPGEGGELELSSADLFSGTWQPSSS